MTLDEFHKLLKKITRNVYHYVAAQEDMPYIVYEEYDQGVLRADNRVIGEFDYVQVDYYTKTERDKKVARLKVLLNKYELSYDYKKIYERKDGSYRHIFDCSLL